MGAGRIIALSVLFLVNFLVLILFTFNNPHIFLLELFVIAVTLLIAFIIILGSYKDSSWANGLAAFFFIVNLANVIYLYFKITAYLLIVLLIVNVIGFIMSVSGSRKEYGEEIEEPVIRDYSKDTIDKELEERDYKTPEIILADELVEELEEEMNGKFVGSKTGNSFHEPGCDFAKRIKKDKRVSFATEKHAKAKGYRAHNCVRPASKAPLI